MEQNKFMSKPEFPSRETNLLMRRDQLIQELHELAFSEPEVSEGPKPVPTEENEKGKQNQTAGIARVVGELVENHLLLGINIPRPGPKRACEIFRDIADQLR